MYKFISLVKSTDKTHKYEVTLYNEETKRNKTIKFGKSGMNDYTLLYPKDKAEANKHKENYLKRHEAREDWTESGLGTSGFWARHLLWNKPTIEASLKNIKSVYKL
jgi:hypothetical protein